VQLFVERARQHQHDFALDEQNAGAVAGVCQRLDGNALAIELAAARAALIGPERLLAALDDRFHALRSGPRTATSRQQTLRGLVEWSWQLLTDPQRELLNRCSVFPSSFTLEAACSLDPEPAADPGETADALEALVAKSLVQALDHGRFVLLETIREFAALEAQRGGKHVAAELRARHRAHFLDLARRAEPHLLGAQRAAWCTDLDAEHDNLEAAIRSSKGDGAIAPGLELLVRLREHWEARGLVPLATELLLDLLADADGAVDARLRCRALADAAWHLGNSADPGPAAEIWSEALDLAEELADPWLLCYVLSATSGMIGDPADELANAVRAVELARSLDDRFLLSGALNGRWAAEAESGAIDAAYATQLELLLVDREAGHLTRVGRTLTNLSDFDIRTGSLDLARDRAVQALAIFEELPDAVMESCAWHNLGLVDLLAGQPVDARQAIVRGYQIARDAGDIGHFPVAIIGLALTSDDDPPRAALLYGAAETFELPQGQQAMAEYGLRDAHLTRLRELLGSEGLEAALDRGRSLSRADAIALAFGHD
jgi:hypothetical protein